MINGINAVYIFLGLIVVAVAMVIAITVITIAGDAVPSSFEVILSSTIGAIVGALTLNATPKNIGNALTGNSEKVE